MDFLNFRIVLFYSKLKTESVISCLKNSDDEKPVVKTRTSSIVAFGDEKSKVRDES